MLPERESSSTGKKTDHAQWFSELPAKEQEKCYLRLERLREMGHELRRPEAEFLRDGIYELRVSLQAVHRRILYFFHGRVAAVVSHGLVEERVVPPKEIDHAVERKKRFEVNAQRHTIRGGLIWQRGPNQSVMQWRSCTAASTQAGRAG
ncbi:MAG: type II toxin-antitoxin system RelE/ParE family toxin [Bryobacteraceae bacterium]